MVENLGRVFKYRSLSAAILSACRDRFEKLAVRPGWMLCTHYCWPGYFTAICAMLMASVAILFRRRRGAMGFLRFLTLPMALTLMSACSQEALLIASSALLVALYAQALRESRNSAAMDIGGGFARIRF